MDAFMEWLQSSFTVSDVLRWKLFTSLLVVAAIIVLRFVIMAFIHRRTDEAAALYRWRKLVEYSGLVLMLFFLGRVWFAGSASLVTYLGLLSAGLAIALQDPISNLFGWLLIMSRRPFEVGDRVEIDGSAGDVVDIRFFQFSVLEVGHWVEADQSTGRVLHIPNKKVFSHAVANYNKGITYIWNEVAVTVTFESNWRRGKELLQQIADKRAAVLAETARTRVREAARRYMINYDKLTPIVYTRVDPHGVVLTIRYLCDPRQRRTSEEVIWEDILDLFARESELAFAYPTQRIYYQGQEQTSQSNGR